MKSYAFVFARGGSKGLPGKNIRSLNGKPLLAWSIDVARSIEVISQVFVSTDDKGTASVARENGAEVINRPYALASDTAPEFGAWQHAVRWVQERYGEFDVFVSLPATAPLRSAADVDRCIAALDESTDLVVTMRESDRSPWFNMVVKESDGTIHTVMPNNGRYARRQDAPMTYDLTTVAYVCRPNYILGTNNAWSGSVRGVVVDRRSAIDIDTMDDFRLAEYLLRQEAPQ